MNPVPDIRQATLSDLEAVAALFDGYRQFYGQAPDRAGATAFLRARFEHGDSTVFIAHAGGVPAGFTQLYPSFSSVSMSRIFVLNDLFVAPAFRQRGLASALLAAATAYARALGAVRLGLSTAVDNTAAQSLYEGAGWRRDDRFLAYQFAVTGRG